MPAVENKLPIAFIGLGAMGFGMATHLIKQGHEVRGFDAYPPTLERFAAAGGKTSNKPSECVKDLSICVLMVATAAQAQEVLFDTADAALPSIPKDAVVMLCSTVPCGYVQGLEKELADRGRADIKLVDAPVSGGAGRAATGELSIMAGGSEAALSAAHTILQTMSDPKKLYIVQGGIGAGSNMKMCHQVLAAAQILSASEAIGFAFRLGLDLEVVKKEIIGGDAWSWMFENRVGRITGGWNNVLSALGIITKDAGIITSEGRRLSFATPMVSAAEQAYLMGMSSGWDREDDGGMVRAYLKANENSFEEYTSTEKDGSKVHLVTKLLIGIHTCAAAEALAFAKHVALDLDQLFELASDAAGGSRMFSGHIGQEMVRLLKGAKSESTTNSSSLNIMVQDLKDVVSAAQAVKCPLFLGSQSLNLAMATQRSKETSNLSSAAIISNWIDL